jgi:signal recognition particle receptor subunit alpha
MLTVQQAVYQSLLHLGWIDKLLDNISTIFIDLYKNQLKSERARIVEYPFDKYFDQQVRELEDNATAGLVSSEAAGDAEARKDPLASSDNGGPPPPPVPGLLKGMRDIHLVRYAYTKYLQRSLKLRSAR